MFSSVNDKLLALGAAIFAIVAYLYTVYLGNADEFLKNIAVVLVGVFAGLLRGEQPQQTVVTNQKTGQTSITTSPSTPTTVVEERRSNDAKVS